MDMRLVQIIGSRAERRDSSVRFFSISSCDRKVKHVLFPPACVPQNDLYAWMLVK